MHITDIDTGMKVRDSNGRSVGKVIAIGADTFSMKKGLFFRKDYEVRLSHVREIRDGEIWLDQPRAALERTTSKDTPEAEEPRAPSSQQHLTAPAHRGIHVERVPSSSEPVRVEGGIQEGATSLPVREEQVTVSELPVVREEVRLAKVPQPEEKRIATERRRELADIEERDPAASRPSRPSHPEAERPSHA